MNTTAQPIKIILTRFEAARALSISEATLDRHTKSGKIPHVRIGGRVLYPVTTLEQWAVSEAMKSSKAE